MTFKLLSYSLMLFGAFVFTTVNIFNQLIGYEQWFDITIRFYSQITLAFLCLFVGMVTLYYAVKDKDTLQYIERQVKKSKVRK